MEERGISPIQEIVEMTHDLDENQENPFPKTPPNSPFKSEKAVDADEFVDSNSTQKNLYSPYIGDLLINIHNIKDSRCLLDSFQNELSHLKKDIKNCNNCSKEDNNYCDKHVIYTPLLRVGEVGSKSDQIKLFNVLKTEVYLKKEIESQIKHISKLERKLSKSKKREEYDEIETTEKELQLANSYLNNLLIKQQNERLLSEQQKIMKDKNEHECENVEECDECCLEFQIHELLRKVRANIAKDIEDSKHRLKIQKMPTIDIRKPLQLQNTLKLDIPPFTPPQTETKKNLVYEAVVKEQDYVPEPKVVNKTTNFEESHDGRNRYEVGIEPAVKTKTSRTEARRKLPSEKTGHNLSEISRNKRGKLEKSPSELGFRRDFTTQCDSNASLKVLNEVSSQIAKVSATTQTVDVKDDSYFLFGFKEYLMKNTEDFNRNPNLVDENIQVSLEESNESIADYRSIGVNTETSKTRLTNSKSCEFMGVTAVLSGSTFQTEDASKDVSDSFEEAEIPSMLAPVKSEDTASKSSKSLTRTPSLKKMFLLNEDHPTEMESSMHNPYVEPKYRMKRFSLNRQESETEMKPNSGDVFYKSLTNKEELPDRKTGTSDGQIPGMKPTSTSKTYLENLISVDKEPDQNTEIFVDEQVVKKSGTKIASEGKKIDVRDFDDHLEHVLHDLSNNKFVSVEKLYEFMEDVEISEKSESSKVEPSQDSNKENFSEEDADGPDTSFQSEINVPLDEKNEDSMPVDFAQGVEDEDEVHEEPEELPNVEKISEERQVKIDEEFIDQEEPDEEVSKTTVLPLLSPTYKLVLSRSGDKNKSDNIVLKVPAFDGTKTFKLNQTPHQSSQQSDKISVWVKKEPIQRKYELDYKSKFYNNELVIPKSPQSRKDITNVTNYILHKPSPDQSTSCKFRSEIQKFAKERLEYSKKCSKLDKSIDSSSLVSSEGEVLCNCKVESSGELHYCPSGRINSNRTGIHYKDKLSSHLILEKERKHYQHWVTYYATKKSKNESTSTLVDSESFNDT